MSCDNPSAALSSSIHVGAVAPYAVKYDVTTDDPDFDLTTVIAARFDVLRGVTGQEVSWSASYNTPTPTPTALRMVHVFAPGDVPEPDVLLLKPILTLSGGGELVCETARLTVRRKFE